MNQLQFETSPYLKQHASNPVNWLPYSPKIIEMAKSQNKLIVLSIGYSACHWCHVLAHESFEDPDIAKYLNQHFIAVKIDREERPDIDHLYQMMGQIMGIQGGWPLSVFLTPTNKPMYIGTYFPKQTSYGRIGFGELLAKLISIYDSEPQNVESQGDKILSYMKKAFERPEPFDSSDITLIGKESDPKTEKILTYFQHHFDEIHGGFGKAPKFPNFPSYVFLLRELNRIKQNLPALHADLKHKVSYSLKKMAHGGIYDQLGGGFHRYSVDAEWKIPHFEKMLYDNAMALVTYSEAYLYYKDAEFKKTVKEIIIWLQSEILDSSGGFYAAMDADSEGQEGTYYGWSIAELRTLIPTQFQELFFEKYGVSASGNFEHNLNILAMKRLTSEITSGSSYNVPEMENILTDLRKQLLVHRKKRIPPTKDDKLITSWNGLLLHGLYSAYRIFECEDFGKTILTLANNLYTFFERNIIDFSTGHLFRISAQSQTKISGNLDDYAYLIQGLLDRYSISNNQTDLEVVKLLIDYVVASFYDTMHQTFYYTDRLILGLDIRPIKDKDMPLPSPSAIMAENLLRYHYFVNSEELYGIATAVITHLFDSAQIHPDFSSSLLMALQYARHGFDELTIFIENDNSELSKEILLALDEIYIPHLIKYTGDDYSSIPRLSDKLAVPGQPFTAYLCQNFNCSKPIHSVENLKDLLHSLY